MLLATLMGILCGVFFGDMCKALAPWGAAYIMLLKVTTIPYLAGALMHGIAQFSNTQAREILKKGLFFIALAWLINIGMIYLATLLFPQVVGVPHGSYLVTEPAPINFADLLIPENIFYSLANNILPSVVVFSLIVGISLMSIKDKQPFMAILETGIKSLTMITAWISRLTPFGTFLIIANQAGTIQVATIQQISTYIILYILIVSLITFWIVPRIVSALTPISAFQWVKILLPVLLLAYTTNLVIVCLPYIIALIERETQILHPRDERAQSQIQGTVSIIFNLPLGSLFMTLFILFIATFYHAPFGLAGHLQMLLTTFLTSLGSIGIGSWINSLTFLLDTLALPLDAVDLFLSSVPFTAGFQSMISAMEITSLSLLITLACRNLINFKWGKLLKGALYTFVPVFALLAFLVWYKPFPELKETSITIYDLRLPQDVNVKVYSRDQLSLVPKRESGELFNQILESKVLRVGYNTNVLPFCFTNKWGEIVGYDIAYAYELAHDLGCDLELVPMDYGNMAEEIGSGLYDIAMSAVSIREGRLRDFFFSFPYSEGKIGFVVRDHHRKKFEKIEEIQDDRSLTIAVFKGSIYETIVRRIFPRHTIVTCSSYAEFVNHPTADALLWAEPQAVAWALENPFFTTVFPKPSLGIDSLGYPVRRDSLLLLNYLNEWLELKSDEGFARQQVNRWILGKPDTGLEKIPRFSLIRNTLHWID
jgi:proton glutamate symport protein